MDAEFTIISSHGLVPPRFRNYEDAMLFMDCLKEKKHFPPERWVHPFQVCEPGGVCVETDEYKNAPYELGYIVIP